MLRTALATTLAALALAAPAAADWSGDGEPDILARDGDGRLLMYRGDGAGGFVTGSAEPVGSGWGSLSGLMLIGSPPTPPPAPLRHPAGSHGRVYARVVFTRPGSRKLRRKTVSRRFVMCG